MMTYQNLVLEKEDHIATITINHPPANTWNLATMQDFKQAIDDVESDPDVRVVVLTGGGEKFFSAGFDVSDAANSATTSPMGREIWRRIERLSKPVVAAVNGFAMGGGLELALSCHFRIMADRPDIRVGLTELNLGIIPGWGGTQRLALVVGKAKALEMILFSKTLTAQEALQIGLVHQLSKPEALLSDALAFAKKLAERPPIAVACVLNAMAAGLYEGLDAGLRMEAEGSARVRQSEDQKEGFAAFLEKRKPVFKGK
jgi:enoyl-CoA hydratase/carnithine racemase